MKNAILIAACLVAVTPSLVAAQTAPKTAEQVKKDVEQTQAIKTKIDEAAQNNPRFVRTLTNVQIELTLTDQIGTNPAEKKTVSMIASSGSWGKIRSTGNSRPAGETPVIVQLDVDARPFVSVDGPIQLELTLNYSPPAAQMPDMDNARARRTSGRSRCTSARW